MKRFTLLLLALAFALSGISLGCNKADENKPGGGGPQTKPVKPTTNPTK